MWWWVMIWVSMFVVAGVYLGSGAWGLWGQAKELGSELVAAQRRLDDVQGQLELVGEQIASTEQLAVLADPITARKQRDHARAAGRRVRQARQARQARRAASRPRWPNT